MKEKLVSLKNCIKRNIGKLALGCTAMVAMVGSAFAEGNDPTPPTPPTVNDFQTLMSKITETFNVSFILSVMGGIIAFGIAYALLYWGARKAIRAGFSAVKKGKIRV